MKLMVMTRNCHAPSACVTFSSNGHLTKDIVCTFFTKIMFSFVYDSTSRQFCADDFLYLVSSIKIKVSNNRNKNIKSYKWLMALYK